MRLTAFDTAGSGVFCTSASFLWCGGQDLQRTKNAGRVIGLCLMILWRQSHDSKMS